MMKTRKSMTKSIVHLVLMLCFILFMGTRATMTPLVVGQARLEISVMSNAQWTDTGLDVFEGQEFSFRVMGQISLQKGNPVTYCGPNGYNYQSTQQPLQDKNIGALIGKVYLLLSVEVDEETGEEIRNEVEELFYVGSEIRMAMPMNGRLFLGVNENLVADDEGSFTVVIFTEALSSDQVIR
jgi:hypothetical protein